MCNSSYILNGNSSTFCMLAYMDIQIALLLVDQTIFVWVIALFKMEYFIKRFVHNFSYILNKNSFKLCMLAYYHMEICM